MGAPRIKFETGRLYSLDNISHLISRFRSKTHLNAKEGMYHLYVNQADESYWIGGPFQGKDSNLFLFLGCPRSQSEMKTLIANLHPTNELKSDWQPGQLCNNSFLSFDDFCFQIELPALLYIKKIQYSQL